MNLIGNSLAAEQTKKSLTSDLTPVVLYGPSGVGKFSFLSFLLKTENVHEVNGNDGVDKLKKCVNEANNLGFWQSNSFVLIRDIENASDSSKDFLLKHLEEPNRSIRYFVVCNDLGKISEALVSRFRIQIKWNPISLSDLESIYKDSLSSIISRGSYSVFQTCYGDKKLSEFYNLLVREDWPQIALSNPLPIILEDWKNISMERKTAISNLFWYASRNSKHKNAFLKCSNACIELFSLNISNYYLSMAAESL